MDIPSVPHAYHNFSCGYCGPSAVTMPQVGEVGPVDPVRPYPRGAVPSTTIPGQPPPTSQLPLAHSHPTVVPESSASPFPTHHLTPSYDVLPLLAPPNAIPRNSLWSPFTTQPFQDNVWHREQGEAEPNNHSLSLSPFLPVSQNLDNDQANIQGCTHSAPTAFTSLPIPEIQYDRITTNLHTYGAVVVHHLINEEQTTDTLPIGGSGRAYGAQGTDTESAHDPLGDKNDELGVPLTRIFNRNEASPTTIDTSNGTNAPSGAPESTSPSATSGPIRSIPSTSLTRHRSDQTVLDRPGKKPPAEYEPDPVELKDRCERRGGKRSATAWIERVFQNGVNVKALMRRLTQSEIEEMNSQGGLAPAQAYDGFWQKTELASFVYFAM